MGDSDGQAPHDGGREPLGDAPTFPHLDERGNAWMVDVTGKRPTSRRAVASGRVSMATATARLVERGELPAGDVLSAARTAGVLAAKKTADLLPLCHPLLLGDVAVDFSIGADYVEIVATVDALDRTGVEMEALTACFIAGLTIYACCKSRDSSLTVGGVAVRKKSGGRSGSWTLAADGTVQHIPAAPADATRRSSR